MTVAKYIIDELVRLGTTDAFGIPGGVILDFLYAMEGSGITPHLVYHEQTAGFAACGYAQAGGKLGVAYATRGPGICNMITAIAEAYQESIPVLFITAHGRRENPDGLRFSENQELNIVDTVKNMTKYAVNIDDVKSVAPAFNRACNTALGGRKGPVLVDIAAGLWKKEIIPQMQTASMVPFSDIETIFMGVGVQLSSAKRPVILVGDGLRHAADKKTLLDIAEKIKIPILSSRGTQDLLSGSAYYFGYIGSHGLRYSNFILSKSDLIIAIGNRMAFPRDSVSFRKITDNAHIIRLDIDDGELRKSFSNETDYQVDAANMIAYLLHRSSFLTPREEWLSICYRLRTDLFEEDCFSPVNEIVKFISEQGQGIIYVCDVGNNEFWFSRAYERSRSVDPVIISKSFGTLGSAIGKSIGAYYATNQNVICVVGDQGFQYNLQELQFIVSNHLPIKMLLVNNSSSGMIADHEFKRFGREFIHVNTETGYYTPVFDDVAKAYHAEKILFEIPVDRRIRLMPNLPKGNACQDMEPEIDRERYHKLNSL